MKLFSVLALLAVVIQYTQADQMLRFESDKSVDFSEGNKPRDASWDGKMPNGSRGGRHPRHGKGPFNGKRRHGGRPPKGGINGGKYGKGKGNGEKKTERSDTMEDETEQ